MTTEDKQFQQGCLCCDRKIFMIGISEGGVIVFRKSGENVLPHICVQYAADIVYYNSKPCMCVLVRPTRTLRSARINALTVV